MITEPLYGSELEKMFLWHFARAVYGAKYHFCGGKGIKGRVSSLGHLEFTALRSVLATEQGRVSRQELLIFFLQLSCSLSFSVLHRC